MKKTESISEFLERGGKITIVPEGARANKSDNVKSTTGGGPAVIISMGEADLFYGEQKPKKAKKKTVKTIDISALPEELRKKYIDEVMNAKEKDEDEDL